ncbi:hypothetical protein [Paenibacillus glycanilyticus]|uniref:ArpU family transcriptional regulator n=1 Tax=Paenibacillus glycanilyticus TaxID=126569 RepID=A0ABQ6NHI2_9BACL|nr:hypothetical protein [Paenibacillus glycanilyticus]GMK44018.1 hypothetical protein PghCCS26_11450 [Paenibacillus glycanilyticus]
MLLEAHVKVTDSDRQKVKQLLKAYPSMKAVVDISAWDHRVDQIAEYAGKCKAIERALEALPYEGKEILTRCFFEQKKDKYIYEFVLKIPKSTYDVYKSRAVHTISSILKAANMI